MKALIDNDILLKGACYLLLDEIGSTIGANAGGRGVLGAARFVVRRKLQKAKLCRDRKLAIQNMESFLADTISIEPSITEQAMAAQFETSALRLGLGLDAGESQLCAIALQRASAMLITGDKRAITALEKLASEDKDLAGLRGKMVCLEQLVLLLLADRSFEYLRSAICLEPDVDKTLTICFSCRNSDLTEAVAREGLNSYIRALRLEAARMLSP